VITMSFIASIPSELQTVQSQQILVIIRKVISQEVASNKLEKNLLLLVSQKQLKIVITEGFIF
jgi:hypothetical protein